MISKDFKLADRRDVVMTIRMALTRTLSGGHRRRRHNLADADWARHQAEAIVEALEVANLRVICGPGAEWHSTPGQPEL